MNQGFLYPLRSDNLRFAQSGRDRHCGEPLIFGGKSQRRRLASLSFLERLSRFQIF